MPRVAIPGQYRFFFYSSDCAEAPHVHVRHERSMARLWVDKDASLAQNDGFEGRELRNIRRLVKQHRRALLPIAQKKGLLYDTSLPASHAPTTARKSSIT